MGGPLAPTNREGAQQSQMTQQSHKSQYFQNLQQSHVLQHPQLSQSYQQAQ